jgi:hypothetical protein
VCLASIAAAAQLRELRRSWTVADVTALPRGLHDMLRVRMASIWARLRPAERGNALALFELLAAAQEPPAIGQVAAWLQLPGWETALLPRLGGLLVAVRGRVYPCHRCGDLRTPTFICRPCCLPACTPWCCLQLPRLGGLVVAVRGRMYPRHRCGDLSPPASVCRLLA